MVAELDGVPPDAGSVTVMVAVPFTAMSAAVIAAFRTVLLTKVVVRGCPFQLTIDVPVKPVPFTVNEKPGPPVTTVVGLMLVIVGITAVIVKVTELETTGGVPGLTTVTWAVPAVATREELIEALSVMALKKSVVNEVPFHCMAEPLTNPVPETVSVKEAEPAATELGNRLLMTGVCA